MKIAGTDLSRPLEGNRPLKMVFLVGSETPLDLLALSGFLNQTDFRECLVGVQTDMLITRKKLSLVLKVLRNSGPAFVLFNSFLNAGVSRWLMFAGKRVPAKVEVLKEHHPIKVFRYEQVNGEAPLSIMRRYSPDVIFNHMPQRIKFPLIGLPLRGIVNIHPGLLPDYQGMGSCLWPLIDGAPFQGVTLHYIDSEEIDAGPIIAGGRYRICARDSVFSLHAKNRILGAALASYLARRFSRGERVLSRPQLRGKYHKLPKRASLKEMKRRGHGYFSWSDRTITRSEVLRSAEYLDEHTGWEWKKWPEE
jgi:hypothetical protein